MNQDGLNHQNMQGLHYNRGVSLRNSGTPLNGHPSTADTCDATDNSESTECNSIDFNTLKPLNNGHPATPYNGHLVGPV